jgi:two-component system, chemotaxis family, CheB/CheR fusion protein
VQNSQALRVLVVEDHAETAVMLAELLRLEHHQVQVAPDGPTALNLAQATPPDVALVDISLPGMDGHEVARQLRGLATDKRPLLIAMTGHAQDEYRQRSEEAGLDLHLVKPLRIEDLRRLLRRFWDIIRPGTEPPPTLGDEGNQSNSVRP